MNGGVSKAAEERFVTGKDESARDADERRAFPRGVPKTGRMPGWTDAQMDEEGSARCVRSGGEASLRTEARV